jgi:eukaryotic-like serine/threonine-protein kinase
MIGQPQYRTDELEMEPLQNTASWLDNPLVFNEQAGGALVMASSDHTLQPTESLKRNSKLIADRVAALPSASPLFGTPYMLHDRFQIHMDRELPHFSKRYAKAYRVTDQNAPNSPCLAYVTDPYHYYREEVIKVMSSITHPSMIELLDSGKVYLPELNANRFVVIYKQPQGTQLRAWLNEGNAYKMGEAMRLVIVPLISVLQKLQMHQVHHGAICAENITVTDTGIVLGDCLAEPEGMSQPTIYEPLEHLLAHPDGRGVGGLSSDVFALAVLWLDVCSILGGRKQLRREQLIDLYLTKGSYNSLVNDGSLPDSSVDFFRGILIERARERWGIEALLAYVSGKRFNLVAPGFPRDCSRPHHFSGMDHYALAALAHTYHQQWDVALDDVRERGILKWLESLNLKSNMREQMEVLQDRIGYNQLKGAQADEMIARAIITLDMQGPLRLRQLSVHLDHLGHMLATAIQTSDTHTQHTIRDIITSQIAAFWQEGDGETYRSLAWQPPVMNKMLTSKSLGFGVERVLYELNPRLPCLSKDYLRYYATNAKSMLLVLDALAPTQMDKSLTDPHLMAFIAARANIRKEVRLTDMTYMPDLAENKELQAIIMLARAQEKMKIASLPGLSCWAAKKIVEMIEQFKSQEIRTALSRDLATVLPSGKLSYLAGIVQNKEYIQKDCGGVIKATHIYRKNTLKIARLKDKKHIWKHAHRNGLTAAFLLSATILFGVCYYMMAKHAW